MLKTFKAATALETPQVHLTWELAADQATWTTASLRRLLGHTPESEVDGVEVMSLTPSTLGSGYGDTSVNAAERYYYGLWLRELMRPSVPVTSVHNLRRFGRSIVGCYPGAGTLVWVLAVTDTGSTMLYSYDTADDLAYAVYDVTQSVNEPAKALGFVGSWQGATIVAMVTADRYLEIELSSLDVLLEWPTGNVDPVGLTWEMAGASRDSIALLDLSTTAIVRLDSAGDEVSTVDLTSTSVASGAALRGLAWYESETAWGVGHGSRVVWVDAGVASPEDADIAFASVLDRVPEGLTFVTPTLYTTTDDRCLVRSTVPLTSLVRAEPNWVEPYEVDLDTLLLMHCATGSEDRDSVAGAPIDDLSAAVAAVGRFGSGLTLAQGSYADFRTALAGWDAETGTVECWFARGDGLTSPAAPVYLWQIWGDADNLLEVTLETDGALQLKVRFNATEVLVAGGQAPPDVSFHHYGVHWDRIAGTLSLLVDGNVVGSASSGGWGWAGTVNRGWVGTSEPLDGTPANRPTWLGTLDEVRVSDEDRAVMTPLYEWVLAGEASAYSGSSYESGFHYRDGAAGRYLPEHVLLRDQSTELRLTGDTALPDGEVIHRESPAARDLDLTQNERLWALLGALLDRLDDRARESFRILSRAYGRAFAHGNLLDEPLKGSSSEILQEVDLLGQSISPTLGKVSAYAHPEVGASAFRVSDVRSRGLVHSRTRGEILENLLFLIQRKGSLGAFQRIALILGFAAQIEEHLPRRQWDSSRDPARDTVPLDSVYWGFDSGHESSPLAKVVVRIFRMRDPQLSSDGLGSTSVPATRRFTVVGAGFDSTHEGSLLRIYEATSGDNGEYRILTVEGPDSVLVDSDWPIGSIGGHDFDIYRRVPDVDPIAKALRGHMIRLKSWVTELVWEIV
jgi:hypothetical protein